jgi:hypothetical protein
MVSALAPGKVAVTAMVGKSTFGSAETGRSLKPKMPNAMIVAVMSVVITGRRMQSSESVMIYAPALRVRVSTRVPCVSSSWPSTTTSSLPDNPEVITERPWNVRATCTGCT